MNPQRNFTGIIFLILLVTCNLYSQSLTAGQIKKVKEASVYIEVHHVFPLKGKEFPVSGTGFFINQRGDVVTNFHVVQPFVTSYGLSYPAPVEKIRIFYKSGSKNSKVYQAKVINVDKKNDLAILGLTEKVKVEFLELGSSENLVETLPVWTFGYPFGEQFTVLQHGPEITVGKGIVSALRHDDLGVLSKIQIDASVNPGNSGGPLINSAGRVIGIVTIAMGTTRVNFAMPVNFLKSMRDSTGSVNILEKAPLQISAAPNPGIVFIDGKKHSLSGDKPLQIHPGQHVITLMKKGYETWTTDRLIKGGEEIKVTLKPLKPIRITGRPVDKKKKKKKTDKNSASSDPARTLKIPPNDKLLMREDFDSNERFTTWEQSTGGSEKRTWFLENNALHQFENNHLLHAIYMGDSTWKDYIFKARIKIISENNDSRAGLIFRETANGFYLFRIHKETDKAQLTYHSKNPFGWFILDEKKLGTDIGDREYELAVEVNQNRLRCFFDNKLVFNTTGSYSSRGKVGFYSVEGKASFDSLRIYGQPGGAATGIDGRNQALNSFWFSDMFDLKSSWWYQTSAGSDDPSPWFYTDGGHALLQNKKHKKISEFTKYHLNNFNLGLVLALEPEGEQSEFEIFFRKTEKTRYTLRFSQKQKKVLLIRTKNGKLKTLKKSRLDWKLLTGSNQLNITLEDNALNCSIGGLTLIKYEGRKLKNEFGTLGLAAQNLNLILHRMNVSSVNLTE